MSKQLEPVNVANALNQDKRNILFSVRARFSPGSNPRSVVLKLVPSSRFGRARLLLAAKARVW